MCTQISNKINNCAEFTNLIHSTEKEHFIIRIKHKNFKSLYDLLSSIDKKYLEEYDVVLEQRERI